MKIMILKIIKHPIYNNLLTWFRVHYKISNNNTYTYNSDTKSGLYKKKKKISLSLSEWAKKKISLNLKISHCFYPNGIFSLTKIWGQNNPWNYRGSTVYIYISNFMSQITYSFVKSGCSIYCFPHSLNSDMSRYGYLEVFQWVPWNSR